MNSLPIESFLFALREEISFYEKTGEPIPEITDEGADKIEAYLNMPFQTGFGEELYPDIYDKASILFYLIIKNHPLENGNKRMAIVTMILFLRRNDIVLKISDSDLYELSKFVAMSDPDDKSKILEYIKLKIKDNMKRSKQDKIDSLKTIIADKTLDESFIKSAEEKLLKLESEPKKKYKMKTYSIKKNAVKADATDVIFLVYEGEDIHENGDLYAFFYNEKESGNNFSGYSEIGQHSPVSLQYAKDSRLATPDEYKDLKKELESPPYGYNLVVAKSKSVLNKDDMKTKKSALETAKEKSKTKKSKSAKPGKMKFFIYVKEEGARSKTRSGTPLTFKVYEIIDNIPGYIGHAKANSAAYKGDKSTVMNFLADEKRIPDNFTGYYREAEAEGIFTIMEL